MAFLAWAWAVGLGMNGILILPFQNNLESTRSTRDNCKNEQSLNDPDI